MFFFRDFAVTVVVCVVQDDYYVAVAVASANAVVDKAGINDLNNGVISIRICRFFEVTS